jgi:hypothetical protein
MRFMRSVLLSPLGAIALCASATVNVNTAQQSELLSTKVLDSASAKQIIVYRNQHGQYKSLTDLVPVIGLEATQKLASQIAFEGDAYVPPPKAEKKTAK